jgi:hypothetical protein
MLSGPPETASATALPKENRSKVSEKSITLFLYRVLT